MKTRRPKVGRCEEPSAAAAGAAIQHEGECAQAASSGSASAGRVILLEEAVSELARGRESFAVNYEDLTAAMLRAAMRRGDLQQAGALLDDITRPHLDSGAPPDSKITITTVAENGR